MIGHTRNSLLAICLVALSVIIYAPSFRGGWTWDDFMMIRDNPALRDASGLRRIWFEPGTLVEYYPVTYSSWWIEQQLWGDRPLPYHVANALLHGIVALLLWKLLLDLNVPGAFFAAAVFVVHPVCVESVAWLSERKNVLSAVFFLGAAIAFIRSMRLGAGRGWYWASMVLYLAAILSKASTVVLPAMLLVICWWKEGAVPRRRWMQIAPMLLLAAVSSGITIYVENFTEKIGHVAGFTIVQKVVLAGEVPFFYLGKLIWPRGLLMIYANWIPNPARWWSFLPLGIIVCSIAVLWLSRARRPARAALAAATLYLLALLPVMGFVNIDYLRFTPVADHFQYLAAMVAISAIIALTATLLGDSPTTVRAIAGAALIVALSTVSIRRAALFGDVEKLWAQTVRENPDAWMAWLNLATHAKLGSDHDAALRHLQEALRRDPENPEIEYELGVEYSRRGDIDTAAAHLQRALEGRVSAARLLSDCGVAKMQRGDYRAAGEYFQRALAAAGDDPDVLSNVATFLAVCPDPLQRDPAQAVRLAERLCSAVSRRTQPNLVTLATTYLSAGRMSEALQTLDEASTRPGGDARTAAAITELRSIAESGSRR